MSSIQIEPTELWQFSITTYQQDELQQELLRWQNSYGGNVNLSLFCMYCDDLGIKISDKELNLLQQQVSHFSIQFTQAIRVTRDHFKQSRSQLTDYDKIRQHLLEAELLLEQQEQTLLCQFMNRDPDEFSDCVATKNKASDSTEPEASNWSRYQMLLKHSSNTQDE